MCFSSISSEQMNGLLIKFCICIYIYEILVGNSMCCFSFISKEFMTLDLSEGYLCSVPCEIIDGFLSNFLHATILIKSRKRPFHVILTKHTPCITNLTHRKIIQNSSANSMPAKAVPTDNKRSPSKLNILLLLST